MCNIFCCIFFFNPETSSAVKQTTDAQGATFGELEFASLYYGCFSAFIGRVGTFENTGVLHCFNHINCWNMRLVSDQLL